MGKRKTAGGQVASLQGPHGYENWKAALGGAASRAAYEVPLLSDVHVTGEFTPPGCPFWLLNTVPMTTERNVAVPVLVLRVETHIDPNEALPPLDKTDTSRYHGGTEADEVAALCALLLGMRLRAGPWTRWFDPDGDPRGRPSAIRGASPSVPAPGDWTHGRASTMPAITGGTRSLNGDSFGLFESYPYLRAAEATTLIRAARLYEQALWVCDAEPHMSWLFLVSAVEVVAVHWRKDFEPAVDTLSTAFPELTELLLEHDHVPNFV